MSQALLSQETEAFAVVILDCPSEISRRNVADGGATRHSAAGSRCWQTGAGCGLPCAPRCTLRWHSPEQQRSWRRHEKALYPAQRRLREADCKVADDTHEMGRKDGDASEVKGGQP